MCERLLREQRSRSDEIFCSFAPVTGIAVPEAIVAVTVAEAAKETTTATEQGSEQHPAKSAQCELAPRSFPRAAEQAAHRPVWRCPTATPGRSHAGAALRAEPAAHWVG